MNKHKGGKKAKNKGIVTRTLLFGIPCIPVTGSEHYQMSTKDRIELKRLKRKKYGKSKVMSTSGNKKDKQTQKGQKQPWQRKAGARRRGMLGLRKPMDKETK